MPNSDPGNSDGYIRALMDISRAITSDLFLEDLLKLIVMVTAKVMEVDICSLWLVEPNASPARLHLKATQAIDPEYVKDRSLSFNEGVVGYVASRARPLVIKDARVMTGTGEVLPKASIKISGSTIAEVRPNIKTGFLTRKIKADGKHTYSRPGAQK